MPPSWIVGPWLLVSSEVRRADGTVGHPFGPAPVGLLVYDPGGWMAVTIMRADRPRHAPRPVVPVERLGTLAEGVALGYLTYGGTYEVDEMRGEVIHHVRMSLMPEQVGVDLVRSYERVDDRLVLGTPPVVVEGREQRSVIVWGRPG